MVSDIHKAWKMNILALKTKGLIALLVTMWQKSTLLPPFHDVLETKWLSDDSVKMSLDLYYRKYRSYHLAEMPENEKKGCGFRHRSRNVVENKYRKNVTFVPFHDVDENAGAMGKGNRESKCRSQHHQTTLSNRPSAVKKRQLSERATEQSRISP